MMQIFQTPTKLLPPMVPRILISCFVAEIFAAPVCPGNFQMPGYGPVELIPTGWGPGYNETSFLLNNKIVIEGTTIKPYLNSRSYFGDTCTAGSYDPKQYLAPNLLGKRITYTIDISKSGCGCNAAFYLTSLHQNTDQSDCHDYYCDANDVCGVSCSEIDIMECNKYAWHSTLHSAHDHGGKGVGNGGGGAQWSGPRDFGNDEYGPGGRCVDTNYPFDVSVEFEKDWQNGLSAMAITLSQEGHSCPIELRITNYAGNAELSAALTAGMTPMVSYWSANDMLWMDGKGADGQGPCAQDFADKCGEFWELKDMKLECIDCPQSTEAPATPVTPAPTDFLGTTVSPVILPPPTPQPTLATPEPTTPTPPPTMFFLPALGTATPTAVPTLPPTPAPTAVATLPTLPPMETTLPASVATLPPLGTTLEAAVECSITRKADCRSTHCCADPGMQCYEKNGYWASCQLSCTPGVDPRDPPGQLTPWTCKEFGTRSPGEALVTTTEVGHAELPAATGFEQCSIRRHESCQFTKCCRDPGLQCYVKNQYWATCQATCTPGVDKRDAPGVRSPWSCEELGARTPGEAVEEPEGGAEELPKLNGGVYIPRHKTSKCVHLTKFDCRKSTCCREPGAQCYEKDAGWAACELSCVAGIHTEDPVEYQTPWTCKKLGNRTAPAPVVQILPPIVKPTENTGGGGSSFDFYKTFWISVLSLACVMPIGLVVRERLRNPDYFDQISQRCPDREQLMHMLQWHGEEDDARQAGTQRVIVPGQTGVPPPGGAGYNPHARGPGPRGQQSPQRPAGQQQQQAWRNPLQW